MTLILLTSLLLIAYITIKLMKILPKEFAILSLILMPVFDGIVLYYFYKFEDIPKLQIAFIILLATILKTILFLYFQYKANTKD